MPPVHRWDWGHWQELVAAWGSSVPLSCGVTSGICQHQPPRPNFFFFFSERGNGLGETMLG